MNMTMDSGDNFPADPKRYPTATPDQVTEEGVPDYNPSMHRNEEAVDTRYASDTELRDSPIYVPGPSEFDAWLERFFTAYHKRLEQYGYAIPFTAPPASGGSPVLSHVTSGPGVIYALNLANTDVATAVYGAIVRESDGAVMLQFTVPIATATVPGTLYLDLGTNGLWYDSPGLSVRANGTLTGVAIVRRVIAE